MLLQHTWVVIFQHSLHFQQLGLLGLLGLLVLLVLPVLSVLLLPIWLTLIPLLLMIPLILSTLAL